MGDLLCQENKDVEAASGCTLFLQENNVDTGPCGWKDQFHQAAGPFEESGGGPRLTFAREDQTKRLTQHNRGEYSSSNPSLAHKLLGVSPKGGPPKESALPSARHSEQPGYIPSRCQRGWHGVFGL